MRNLRLHLLLLVLAGAGLGYFFTAPPPTPGQLSINGVMLGMHRSELTERFGEPAIEGEPDRTYYRLEGDQFPAYLVVGFDSKGRVRKLSGNPLELDGIELEFEDRDDSILHRVEAVLGPADGHRASGFTYERRYERWSLTVMRGCTGWSFHLGDARGSFKSIDEDPNVF